MAIFRGNSTQQSREVQNGGVPSTSVPRDERDHDGGLFTSIPDDDTRHTAPILTLSQACQNDELTTLRRDMLSVLATLAVLSKYLTAGHASTGRSTTTAVSQASVHQPNHAVDSAGGQIVQGTPDILLQHNTVKAELPLTLFKFQVFQVFIGKQYCHDSKLSCH